MNQYKYSAAINMFYPVSLQEAYENNGTWPDDAVDVDDAVYWEFSADIPPEGKTRVVGTDGLPAWGDAPVVEPVAPLLQTTRKTVQELSLEAFALQCAADEGTASPEQLETLASLKQTIAERIGENKEAS
ncbi:tail fiber assembly protein [Salmonella enterica subsp. enterica]|nr:tail fiber assembly protein [Salmonella enterica subsp. enterica]